MHPVYILDQAKLYPGIAWLVGGIIWPGALKPNSEEPHISETSNRLLWDYFEILDTSLSLSV